jgi:glycosyltransferase involved in cell wall biosynthesis
MRRDLELREALRGRDIVCFSNDWKGDPLSKMHLMRALSKENSILWVNSLGNRAPRPTRHDALRIAAKLQGALGGLQEVEPDIHVLSPLALPIFGSGAARQINRAALRLQIARAMRRLGFARPVVWTFLPSAEWVARSLDPALLIYHCVDEFSAFSDAPSRAISEAEARLVAVSDLVITSAERLFQAKRAMNPRTVLVRHGVDHAHFARALEPELRVPPEIARLPRPIFGFFGLVADWVDLELFEAVAEAFPAGNVVVVGRARTDVRSMGRWPNVHLLGPRPYAELPAIAKGFDVALLPFRINELTLNANPLKVREYLAAGLPVVSTAVPEVEELGQCLIGRGRGDFLEKLREALKAPGPRHERSEAVRRESWAARVEEIRGHVAAVEAEKRRRVGPTA